MPQVSINPRWRVQLEGADEDIALLERLLIESVTRSDDFAVFRQNGIRVLQPLRLVLPGTEEAPQDVFSDDVPVLTTTRWDALEPAQLLAQAATQLKILSGSLTLLTGSRPITIGTVYEVRPGGGLSATRVTAIPISIRPSESEYPTPQKFRRIIELTDTVDALRDILAMQSEELDWFVIYKIIEGISRYIGGDNAMRSCPYLEGGLLKQAKQMANSARHLYNSAFPPPNPPMTLDDAQQLVRRSAKILIDRLVNSDS